VIDVVRRLFNLPAKEKENAQPAPKKDQAGTQH
jgi:hypothetical protein